MARLRVALAAVLVTLVFEAVRISAMGVLWAARISILVFKAVRVLAMGARQK